MSKFGRLNEFTEDELEAELAVRRRRRVQGACDYCGEFPESKACRFPERHTRPVAQTPLTIDTIVCDLCNGVESSIPLPCLKCGGKREVTDHLAVAFERALLAVFGEREKEFSSTLRRKLRSLWGSPLEPKTIKTLSTPLTIEQEWKAEPKRQTEFELLTEVWKEQFLFPWLQGTPPHELKLQVVKPRTGQPPQEPPAVHVPNETSDLLLALHHTSLLHTSSKKMLMEYQLLWDETSPTRNPPDLVNSRRTTETSHEPQQAPPHPRRSHPRLRR